MRFAIETNMQADETARPYLPQQGAGRGRQARVILRIITAHHVTVEHAFKVTRVSISIRAPRAGNFAFAKFALVYPCLTRLLAARDRHAVNGKMFAELLGDDGEDFVKAVRLIDAVNNLSD